MTVVGKDTGDNYWIIDVPGYPGTVCWLSGQYASVSGDTTDLSVPATTAILYALSSPDDLRISCNRPARPPDSPHLAPAHRGRITRGMVARRTWVARRRRVSSLPLEEYRSRPDRYMGLQGWVSSCHLRRRRNLLQRWMGLGKRLSTYGVQVFNSTAMSGIETISTG